MEIALDLREGGGPISLDGSSQAKYFAVGFCRDALYDAASFGRMGFPGVFRGVWVIYRGINAALRPRTRSALPPGITRHQIMTRLRNPGLANPALN